MTSIPATGPKSIFVLLLRVSRPKGWPILAAVFFAGAWFSGSAGVRPVLTLAMLLAMMIPMNLLGYGINDVYDLETDRRNPRKKVLITNDGERRRVTVASYLAAGLVFLVALCSWRVETIVLTAALLGVSFAYSVPPLRLKERPPLDSLANGLGYFLLPALIGWSLQTDLSYVPVDVFWVALGIAGIHAFSSIADFTADKDAGQRTFAIAFGRRTAAAVCVATLVSVGLMVPGFWVPWFCAAVALVVLFHPTDKWAKYGLYLMYLGFLAAVVHYFIFLADWHGNPFVERRLPPFPVRH